MTICCCSKQAEIDRKKAEVRARLEAQAAGKKAKKGFMTPERKKKLRVSQSFCWCCMVYPSKGSLDSLAYASRERLTIPEADSLV